MNDIAGVKGKTVLPALDLKTNMNYSPHVVILGAGASKAALPRGDANSKQVPVMSELIDCLGLSTLLQSQGINPIGADFEALYDDLASSNTKLAGEIERALYEYFSSLALPETATLYDYLVLGLREKDLIATFNWDPFLAQAWRRNSRVAKLPRIVFLHGNVEIAVCTKHRQKNFIGNKCPVCGRLMEPAHLLYPVKHKDYNSDPFIASEWEELQRTLQHAYLLTIFGYAAPVTDVKARELMLSVWEGNPTYELAQIEIIDTKPRKELERTWSDFFCRDHYGISKALWQSYLFWHPRRSCEAFAMATLQNSPWPKNPFPRLDNLQGLQSWARILWKEETAGQLSGKKLSDL